jgi:hypothetical protein
MTIQEYFDQTVHHVSDSPKQGGIFVILCILFSHYLQLMVDVYTWEIPKIVMQVFQLMAWGVAIFLGTVSIASWVKKKISWYLEHRKK